MAVIIAPVQTNDVVQSFAPVTMTASDTMKPKTGALYVFNSTGATVNLTIDGAGGTTVVTPNAGVVSVASGYAVACLAGRVTKVKLGAISGFLSGVVAVTGGATGVFAWVE